MKKITLICLISALCFALAICCYAADENYGEIIFEEHVNEEWTAFATVYEDNTIVLTGEGIADLYYLGAYIPMSTVVIGEGITDVINVFDSEVKKYVVDENNPYLSSDSDGVLYNKDKTELIAYPERAESEEVYTVADTVKHLRDYCFYNCCFSELILPATLEEIGVFAFYNCRVQYLGLPETIKVLSAFSTYGILCEALIVPESVEIIEAGALSFNYFDGPRFIFIMNPECEIAEIGESAVIIGYSGSTAEAYALENGIIFEALDKDHSHIYLPRIQKIPTCSESGSNIYDCPCGNAQPYTKTFEAAGHYFDYEKPAEDGKVYCAECGAEADCNCICHRVELGKASAFEEFIYKVLSFFWQLLRTNEYCKCGYGWHY